MHPTDQPVLILDGACGSNIQQMDLPAEAWGDYAGCNEYLNVSAPEAVAALHASFLDAGAQVIETNTFGANEIVLAEYGLQERTEEICRAAAACARQAVAGRDDRWVAGSIGPTTKLPSLGHIDFDAMLGCFTRQIGALVDAGVDLLMIETCQDLLQAKIALIAARDAVERAGRDVPIMISVTVENTGTMLVGADVAAAIATIEPFGVFSLGLNCATGPERMSSHIRTLSRVWPGRISCLPNAGMPQVVDGRTVYPLGPDEFAARVRAFVETDGVSVVGGCCGTTPEHIRRLVEALDGVEPAERAPEFTPSLASGYQAVPIAQEIPPLLIGERANANGSRRFREALLADDIAECGRIALAQQAAGAHAIDLCTAYAGRDEVADMTALVRTVAESAATPLVIDSTTPEVIEACLKLIGGRCIINSINLEDGGATLRRVATLAKRFGAAVIALTINERGMAMTADEKVATAKAIAEIAVGECGLRPGDLLFDDLTFTVGAGDPNLADAAVQTLEGLRRIKAELPGVHTSLGVSNISFGLEPASRRVLNSVFLHEAIDAGLDAAIIDAGKVLPLAQIDQADRDVCLDLLTDRAGDGERTPLTAFIEHFAAKTGDGSTTKTTDDDADRPAEQAMFDQVVAGDRAGLEDLLSILMRRMRPLSIINDILVPAMRQVGELFGRGELLLPFVLQSAEVMKRSVDILEPFMDKTEDPSTVTVLLATVAGDVHDIGKNLVDIILSNNGYTVVNLGTKVPAETIIAAATEHKADVIGLSGLLVKSAIVMQETMPQFKRAGLTQPVLLGGAALTEKFVAESCVPGHDAPVRYCADAFAGLAAMRAFEAGDLTATTYDGAKAAATNKPGAKTSKILRTLPVPSPPFWGARHVEDIDPARLFPYVNEQALFRGRWGYRRGKMAADEYATLIDETVRPLYEKLKARAVEEQLIRPKVAYGYFPCRAEGDSVVVEHDGRRRAFAFPRQADPPHLCIADFFRTDAEGGDVAAFFVATVGEQVSRETAKLFDGDEYHAYLMLHAFSVEVTDALAEYWHEVMRREMGIDAARPDSMTGYVVQDYQGSRYGFGYPACPDLSAHEEVFAMLEPERIGVTLTETMEMVPEQSTSAIIAHHRQAKYFAV